MTMARRALVALVVLALGLCEARPLVRNVRTDSEFKRLLKYHKDVTGMGVIVDFYSDGCGPCRQIAPHYKEMAKRYKDQVVFAKVDVNYNRETSGAQRIRSMPTFQFYMNGKKRHQFSGGDLQQLQQWAGMFASEFRTNNVRVTPEALEAFYTEHAPEKATEEGLAKIMAKAGGDKGGKGHRAMVKALKKKYGVAPKTVPRYDPNAPKKPKEEAKEEARAKTTPPPSGRAKKAAEKPQPNLDLATLQELEQELEKRKAEIEALREEFEDNDDEDGDGGDGDDDEEADPRANFEIWTPGPSGVAESVVIIGGGPAGLSAAVYAARAGLRPVVIAPPAGGQLQGKGVLVENYPAVVDSTGPAVVFEMQKQAAKYGAVFLDEMVTAVELADEPGTPHKLTTETANMTTYALIIATGADSRWLGVPGEEEYRGGGVSTCATCDGYLYRDKPVVVVGGGDTAMEEALHLAHTSSEVTIVHRGAAFDKASVVLANRVLQHEKVRVMWNTTVASFEGRVETDEEMAKDPHRTAEGADLTEPEQPILTGVAVRSKTGVDTVDEQVVSCEGAFIAIGHDPNTGLFKGQLDMNAVGYLHTKHPSTQTSRAGVFAAGDVADPTYRQAITSAGTGAMAALDAERWLAEHGIEDQRKALEDEFMRELLDEVREPDCDAEAA